MLLRINTQKFKKIVTSFFLLNLNSDHKRMNDFVHACTNLSCTAPSLSSNIAGQFNRNVLAYIFIIYFPEFKLGERNFPLINISTFYKATRDRVSDNLILLKIMHKSFVASKLIRSLDSGLESHTLNTHRSRTKIRHRHVSY